MINRRQLHENAVGNPLMRFVRQLRKDVDYLLHNAIVNPERLSDLSEDLGYIQAGAFICGTGSLEDGDFTGNMMIYPSYEDADGDNFTIFGMNNGTLTVGWNSDDGKFYFGGKQGWLDADGLAIIATTPGGGLALPNQVKWMVGATAVSGLIAYRDITNDMIPAVWYANGTVDEREASLYAAATNYGSTKIAYIYLYAPVVGNSIIYLVADSVVLPNDSISYAEIQNVSETDKLLGRVSTGAGNIEEIDFSNLAQTLLDDTTQNAMQTTLGLVIGTDVQAWDAQLDQLAACQVAADGDFIVGLYGDGGSPTWQKQAKATARASMGMPNEMAVGVLASLDDDTAMSFTPLNIAGKLLVFGRATSTRAGESLFDGLFRVTSNVFLTSFHLGTLTVTTTGALTDGTSDGTDTKFNVSVHTDGKIYFKNRTGATLALYYAVM